MFVSAVFEAEHPVVHVHPVTGERALLLGHFIKKHRSGLSSAESARIFEIAAEPRDPAARTPCAGAGSQDDVAIWDNRATQHFAINDYGNQPRVVRRVTVHGECGRVGRRPARSRTRTPARGGPTTRSIDAK